MTNQIGFGNGVKTVTAVLVLLCGICSGHLNPLLPREVQRHIQTKLENAFFREVPDNLQEVAFSSKVLLENLVPFFMRDVVGSEVSTNIVNQVRANLFAQKTNPRCVEELTELFTGVFVPAKEAMPTTWALHMMDSWGKLPSGIFSGNVMMPGDFLECIHVSSKYKSRSRNETSDIKGSYCSTYLIPGPNFEPWLQNGSLQLSEDVYEVQTKDAVTISGLLKHMLDLDRVMILPFMGTCFPASCTADDVQTVLTTFYDNTTSGVLNQVTLGCVTDEKPPFKVGHYFMIAVLTAIVSLCILATVYDVDQQKQHEYDPSSEPSQTAKVIIAFSLRANTKKWLNTRGNPDNLGCLHGLRTLSMAWIVLAHTWVMAGFQFNWNMIGVVEWYRNWSYFPILNGTISVDTFFTMSGALLSYNLLRELDKRQGQLNYGALIVHRYLRITPTYVIIVGMMATLLPYVGTGPQWYAIEMESHNCEVHWWHNILYINNLISYGDAEAGECYTESWYLANDMQYFILAPLVVYPLWRWKYFGYFILVVLSCASVVTPTYIMHEKKLDPTLSPFSKMYTSYMENIYTKPWTRCGPYIAGLILGYLLHIRKKNPTPFENISKTVVFWGWTLSTIIALTIIYFPIPYFNPDNADMSHTAWHSHLYGGVHRYAWGVVISWIIFACVNGNAGAVNKFLSWKVFMPLGRLTFCMYISSYHLQISYHMSQVLHPVHVSAYSVVHLFFAHFVAAALLAYFLMITLESPFLQLEKILLKSHSSPPGRSSEFPKTPVDAAEGVKEECKQHMAMFGLHTRKSEVPGSGDKFPVIVTAARSKIAV